MVILGRTANGWKEWKNKDGVQIDQLRKQAAADAISAEGAILINQKRNTMR